MDIAKILEFHQRVMQAAGEKPCEDETSCGPLCQHPACWSSNRRRERGVPRICTYTSSDSDSESDLPTVSYYNMLEDYGDSPKDRYPARYGGRALHERSSSMRNISHPLHSPPSIGMTTAPFATPVSPEKTLHPLAHPPVRLVEVQEVFDKADLNSRWDETFVTRQYLVWVPNPRKRNKKKKQITPRAQQPESPKSLLPKDLTEVMVPLEIKQRREETILKKQARTQSPIFHHGTFPHTPNAGAKPDVDAEGIRELLGLPRDVLVEVLERTKESDFVSRDKIHGIIEEVLSTARDRGPLTGRDAMTRRSAIDTSDVLRQQKLELHHSAQRHMRSSYTAPQAPVFQLDDDEKSLADSARGRAVSDIESTEGRYVKARLPAYKKPLPAIIGDQETPRSMVGGKEKRKIPSVSLGLPELPSGLRQTRTFTYNNRHQLDFSLVPVPTPPTSVRSSGSGSDHGTTMRVNLPSVSDMPEGAYYCEPIAGLSTDRTTREDGALHLVSPALSTNVPLAPAGTPATYRSPTKMYRDFTGFSSTQAGDGLRSVPPSRDITMSPGHKIVIPNTAPATTPAADDTGLDTIRETAREHGAASSMQSSQPGRVVQYTEPPPPPSTPLDGQPADSAANGGETMNREHNIDRENHQLDSMQVPQQGKDASPDYWPQVTEPAYDVTSDPAYMAEQSMVAEHGSMHKGRSDLGSRGSNRSSSLARRIMDEGGKQVESPAPPPPSPEPKEQVGLNVGRGKHESKSRESTSMEPLLEQNESDCSSPQKSVERKNGGEGKSGQVQPIEPVIQEEVALTPQPILDPSANPDSFDPVSKVMVSHVAPQPSGSRERLQQTFMNVDIPAEDISSLQAEQGSSGLRDLTPSEAMTPEKMLPMKGTSPKSSPGPASPDKKSPSKSSPGKTGSGGKKGERRGGSGKEKKSSSPQTPKAEGTSESTEQQ